MAETRTVGDILLEVIMEMHPVSSAMECENETAIFKSYLFTPEELRGGAIAIHVLVTLYVFVSLAIICEHYFVPAIEMFAKDFKIPTNVAGASLMASAASIPQLANTLIGMFIAHDDIGVGAVVGSAFFSVLLIPAICGLAVKGCIQLKCLAMTRDCVTYMVASILLGLCIYDKYVWWYESVILILSYGVYLLVLIFNSSLEELVSRYGLDERSTCCAFLACHKCVKKSLVDKEQSALVSDESVEKQPSYDATKDGITDKEKEAEAECQTHMVSEEVDPDEIEYHSALTVPENKWFLPFWLIMLPANLMLFITIPDPRRPGCWRRLYGLTLLISVLYIALTSYVLIWMITVIGDVLGASVTVMGMTLLAVGSSLPDAFNSVFSARDGYGEMALANTMGSINFDILFCLGFPWLLNCITKDEAYVVLDENLVLVTLCLLCSAVFILIVYVCTGWRIDLKVSIFFLIAYALFMVVATWFVAETTPVSTDC